MVQSAESLLDISIANRRIILKLIENMSLDQLNTIPEGFSNSIAWNVVHLFVTEQLLSHGLSGMELNVSEEMVASFRKGTKPEAPVTKEVLDLVKQQYLSILEDTQESYRNGVFKTFQVYPTSAGYTLNSIEEAMAFTNFHEGIHLGVILALRKLV